MGSEAITEKAKNRYRNLIQKTDPRTGVRSDYDLGDTRMKSKETEIAFTYRRVVPETGEEYAYSEVDIDARGLRDILKKEIGIEYPGVNLEGDSVNITSPFACIVSWISLVTRASDCAYLLAVYDWGV